MKQISLLFIFLLALSAKVASTSKRLTHVVMPFHSRQIGIVRENLRIWSVYPPCKPNSIIDRFIFFVSGTANDTLKGELLQSFISSSSNLKCFGSVGVEFAGLEDRNDGYLRGSRLMFEHMISKSIDFGEVEPSHVFYMEPDCIPIRPYWLDEIQRQVITSTSPFWMKGSIYQGHGNVINQNFIYNRVHINGNAIYNVEDERFRDFYFNFVRPFIKSIYPKKEGAYDTDIFKLLFWKNGIYGARVFHLFKFSTFIQNNWHSKYSLSEILENCPDTYLIHGGKDID